MAPEPPQTRNDVTPQDPDDSSSPHPGRFELWITEGGGTERAWTFDGNQFSIGSHPSNELVLRDAAVSRFHCDVRCQGDTVSIRDLDSRNGTSVEGVRVKEAYLRAGTQAQVGRVLIRFGSPPAPLAVPQSMSDSFGGLVGQSAAMRTTFALLERATQSQATVLLE